MGSEVDLAVESILPKECPNVSREITDPNLITELANSMIFHRVSPRLRSPPCISLERSVIESPSSSDLSVLSSTPVVSSTQNNLEPTSAESSFHCEASSAGAPNNYISEDSSDSDAVDCACRDLIDEAILGCIETLNFLVYLFINIL